MTQRSGAPGQQANRITGRIAEARGQIPGPPVGPIDVQLYSEGQLKKHVRTDGFGKYTIELDAEVRDAAIVLPRIVLPRTDPEGQDRVGGGYYRLVGNTSMDVDFQKRPPKIPLAEYAFISTAEAAAIEQGASQITGAIDQLGTFGVQPPPAAESLSAVPSAAGGSQAVGQLIDQTIRRTLNWRGAADDLNGFLAALRVSFVAREQDGQQVYEHRDHAFAPVAPELGAGPSGPQASLLTRAHTARAHVAKLLVDLRPLKVDADPERVEAHKAVIRRQFDEVLSELGRLNGVRVLRLDQLWNVLLGTSTDAPRNPDEAKGSLGELRKEMGLRFTRTSDSGEPGNLAVTIEEDQVLTQFRTLFDYLTDQREAYVAYRDLLVRDTGKPKFFGAQLVAIERTLAVVAESVAEVRAALDSIAAGPAERVVSDVSLDGAAGRMSIEDLLTWIEELVVDKAPALIRESGNIALTNVLAEEVNALSKLVVKAADPNQRGSIIHRYPSPRVIRAMRELRQHVALLEQQLRP